jgi:hypothetical protein
LRQVGRGDGYPTAGRIRVLIARGTGLSNTDAYYTQWARLAALSYYDHPSLVAWTRWLIQRATVEPWAV